MCLSAHSLALFIFVQGLASVPTAPEIVVACAGKEFEARIEGVKPGTLSEELRKALGMADDTAPPPWLINMQRYGPPPSYPNLRVPGLNAPIPPGECAAAGDGDGGGALLWPGARAWHCVRWSLGPLELALEVRMPHVCMHAPAR